MSTFDNYLFTTNSTEYVCPKWINGFDRFWCKHPSACADGPNTLRQYCCNAHTDDICWSGRSVCASDGSTFTCSDGSFTWCCLKDIEACTQRPGQKNVCISLADNILMNISSSVLEETYSYMSAVRPLSSFYTFDPHALLEYTSTEAPTTSTSTPVPTTSGNSYSQTSTHHPSSSTNTTSKTPNRFPTETSTIPTTAASKSEGNGVSLENKIALGVGLPAVVIAALGLFIMWRWRKGHRARVGEERLPRSF